jgi:NAD(P) transhydrogenase subunit beta
VTVSQGVIDLAYVVAALCLVLGIKRLSSPATARSGNVIAAAGMTIALVFTLLDPDIDTYWLIAAGVAIGTVVGVASARIV